MSKRHVIALDWRLKVQSALSGSVYCILRRRSVYLYQLSSGNLLHCP